MNTDTDIAIVGGGLVGASLALALSGRGLRISVLEATPPGQTRPSYDDRAIALSFGSRRIFDALGLWSDLAAQTTPIRQIHVSDRGRMGITRLDAVQEGVPALGHVVTARVLGHSLLAALGDLDDVTSLAPARVTAVEAGGDGVRLTCTGDGAPETLSTRLLVAADGGESSVRKMLSVPVREWQYDQSALVANVTPASPHNGVAYERFTEQGPTALLPMTEDRCALVWTFPQSELKQALSWDDDEFLQRLQTQFGYRLGRFTKVGRRAGYPLKFVRALEFIRPRTAIIGNAAHTLHPIAGQGLNLGLRDVAALAETLHEAAKKGEDIGSDAVLAHYDRWRRADQRRVSLVTDGLVRVFANPLPLVRAGRNLGLLLMNQLPFARGLFARHAMGAAGRLPRLARGVPLD